MRRVMLWVLVGVVAILFAANIHNGGLALAAAGLFLVYVALLVTEEVRRRGRR